MARFYEEFFMAEDIFDIVDANDTVIGSAPRSQVHKEGLKHRAAHVLIFSGEGEQRKILLQKRSMKKDLCAGKFTTSCSGHIDSGESYEIGVLRELREETGLVRSINQLEYIGKIPACMGTGEEFTAVYELFIDEATPLSFSPDEIDSFTWATLDEFAEMILNSPQDFTTSFLSVFGFYLSKKKI